MDVLPTELRAGDRVVNGGRLVAITDLRYRHGGTRIMILAGGRPSADPDHMVRRTIATHPRLPAEDLTRLRGCQRGSA
ncbi:hypothetical protein AB0M92_23810 [Streptomyces sp. NPDC051582]|uniref:hypothetical protein n=1 Tax=Streptomyces sp. NPDC051582 TaxID=3155167 RepID=UPI00343146A8